MTTSNTLTTTKLLSYLCLVAAMLVVSNVSAAEPLRSAILACATKAGDAEQLNCYKAIAEGLEAQSTQSVVASTADNSEQKTSNDSPIGETYNAEDGEIKEMDASMGGGDFAEKAGVKPQLSRGHVTSCKKSADRRWFFIFDNGQVWKQIDNRRRRFRDCDFDVFVSEDAFGYKMHLEGKDTTIRIKRIR